MAKSILELVFQTIKEGQGGKQAAAELKELKGTVGEVTQGLLGFNIGSITAAGAVVAVGGAAIKSVTSFLDYADTVREMSRVTGQSAEETSRLIQLTDDLGVEQSVLEIAMSGAARKGIAFTTESLAKLADQYVQLADPVSRNALLIANFGESGLKMAAAMVQGGDAIRQMSSAVEANLILTDAQVKQGREYQVQVDNLKDKLKGLEIQAGQFTVPALTFLAAASNNSASAAAESEKQFGALLGRFPPLVAWYAITATQSDVLKNKLLDEAKAAETSATSLAHKYAAGQNPNSPGKAGPNLYTTQQATSSNWGNQTLTVNNNAKLEVSVKVDQRGSVLSLEDAVGPAVREIIRSMIASGTLKVR